MYNKKVMALLILVLAVCFVTPAFAITDVGFGGGVMAFMEKGKATTIGWSAKGRFPWGINTKSITPIFGADSLLVLKDGDLITIPVADTSITFEVLTEVMTVYSDFPYKDYQEVEAEVATTKLRKTLGFFGTSIEGGITVWHFRGTSMQSDLNNTTIDGYYGGFHVKPFDHWEATLGGFVLPRSDNTDTYVLQFGITIIL